MTTAEIKEWLSNEYREFYCRMHGYSPDDLTHMIVVCDTFSWEDYPVFVTRDQDVREVEAEYDDVNMQRIMEVYSLSMDIEKQLAEKRAFHYD